LDRLVGAEAGRFLVAIALVPRSPALLARLTEWLSKPRIAGPDFLRGGSAWSLCVRVLSLPPVKDRHPFSGARQSHMDGAVSFAYRESASQLSTPLIST
jgi:hypothetical protein